MATGTYGKGDTNWFTQSRFGMFLHWGLYSLGARHEWLKNFDEIADEDYQKYFDHFDPDLYDPKAWARMAKQAGMEYFVITTKHHEGFCLWDSEHTDYKAPNTPCGKDLLKPMVEAFRAEGIKVGFYYSLLDWHHPEFPVDERHPQRNNKEFRKATKNRDVSKYADYMYKQVEELLTEYHPEILWFDFSYPGEDGKGHEDWQSERLIKRIREICPDIIVNNRLDLPGSGDVVTPEQYQPIECPKDEDGNPAVWEACQTLSGSWGYHRDEQTWRSMDELLRTLIDCVSKSGNLLLNVGPTARGEFDYRAQDRLEGFAEWMHTNRRSIYGCSAAPDGLVAPTDCRYTYNEKTKRLYVHVFAYPYKALHLPGLAGKVKYAQFLHDASEIKMRDATSDHHENMQAKTPDKSLTLQLPQVQPNIATLTIELFLK